MIQHEMDHLNGILILSACPAGGPNGTIEGASAFRCSAVPSGLEVGFQAMTHEHV